MRLRPDGDFGVTPSEKIRVKNEKAVAPYAAAFSDLIHSSWDSVVHPNALTEIRTFTAPSTVGSMATFGIFFDFIPDAQGNHAPTDQYTVTISGQTGAPVPPDQVFPPPPAHRSYAFVVE